MGRFHLAPPTSETKGTLPWNWKAALTICIVWCTTHTHDEILVNLVSRYTYYLFCFVKSKLIWKPIIQYVSSLFLCLFDYGWKTEQTLFMVQHHNIIISKRCLWLNITTSSSTSHNFINAQPLKVNNGAQVLLQTCARFYSALDLFTNFVESYS